jgi:hypothetical protein
MSSAERLLAKRLVEVPMRVSVPPNIEAYESGISSFDGEVPPLRATSEMTGTSSATTGVLFTRPEVGPARPIVARSCLSSLLPTAAATRVPTSCTTPVRRTPSLRMSIARTAMVASFEKPERPSAGDTCVHGWRMTSNTNTNSAVTSTRTYSVTNNANATAMIPNTTSMSVVIGGMSATIWSPPDVTPTVSRVAHSFLVHLDFSWGWNSRPSCHHGTGR